MKADYYRDQLLKFEDPNENYELYYEMNVFCINLKKEQESLKFKLDEFRERVIGGEKELDFNHPDFNKILDDFNELCNEIKELESLMTVFDHERAQGKRMDKTQQRLLALSKTTSELKNNL